MWFSCYAACVILFFGTTGFAVSADTTGNLSPVVEWVSMPGSFLALWSVGVHSDHFVLASILENIAFYLIVPVLLWKIFLRLRKNRNSETLDNPVVPRQR